MKNWKHSAVRITKTQEITLNQRKPIFVNVNNPKVSISARIAAINTAFD
jgi:hypothetical protein